MSICSVVVFTRPDSMNMVSGEIGARAHCDVVAAESGRVIVVIDTNDRQQMSDTIMALNDIPGVVGVSLVYEYFEPGDSIGGKPASGAENGAQGEAEEGIARVADEPCGCGR